MQDQQFAARSSLVLWIVGPQIPVLALLLGSRDAIALAALAVGAVVELLALVAGVIDEDTATIDARIMPYDGKSIPEYIARCEDAVGERVRLIYNGKDRGEFIVVGVQFVPEIDATCGIFACAISFNLTEGTIRYRERVKDVVV